MIRSLANLLKFTPQRLNLNQLQSSTLSMSSLNLKEAKFIYCSQEHDQSLQKSMLTIQSAFSFSSQRRMKDEEDTKDNSNQDKKVNLSNNIKGTPRNADKKDANTRDNVQASTDAHHNEEESEGDEGTEDPEKLIKKMFGDKLNPDAMAKLDQQIKNNEIFKTREQQLSFDLMNAEDSKQALEIYKQQLAEYKELTPNELALSLYFTCQHKEDLKDDQTFASLKNKVLQMLPAAEGAYLALVVQALGFQRVHNELTLTDREKQVLSESVANRTDEFSINHLSTIAFASLNIFNEPNDQVLLGHVVAALAKRSAGDIEVLSLLDIINYLYTFSMARFDRTDIINKFIGKLIENKEDLNENDIVQIVTSLSGLPTVNKKLIEDFIILLLNSQDTSNKKISADNACAMIFALSHKTTGSSEVLDKLLGIVNHEYDTINITNYINMWLALAKLKLATARQEKTIEMLKLVPEHSKVFNFDELEGYELVNIVVSMSALKVNDKEFLGKIVNLLKPKLQAFDKNDLINLARSFIVYIRQQEEFYLKIHSECCARMADFTQGEVDSLKQTFKRVRAIIPTSPFVDASIA